RRHTRCLSDWSSDVCSSDLSLFWDAPQISRGKFDRLRRATAGFTTSSLDGLGASRFLARSPAAVGLVIRFLFIGSRLCSTLLSRSEERRVGKECRFRWWRCL